MDWSSDRLTGSLGETAESAKSWQEFAAPAKAHGNGIIHADVSAPL